MDKKSKKRPKTSKTTVSEKERLFNKKTRYGFVTGIFLPQKD
jgi:hypothetical protein